MNLQNKTGTDYTHRLSCTHMQTHTDTLLQYISWDTAVTYREWGYALLSQLVHKFSKSSSCLLLFLSNTHAIHSYACTNTYTHSSLSLTLFQFTQAPPESGYHSNPWIVENPLTSPHSLRTGRENNRENGRLGERALGVYKLSMERSIISMQKWRALWLM